MSHSKLVAGIVVAGILSLGACGGDDKALPSPTSAAPTATDAPGATTGGGGSGGGGGGGGGAVPADCAQLYQKWAAAMGGAMTGTADADLANVFQGLAAIVPAELQDDVSLLSDTFGEYLTLLQKYQGDVTKAMQDPQVMAALEALDDDAVQAASENLSNYLESVCPGG